MSRPFVSSAGLSSAKEPRLLPQKKLSAALAAAAEWLSLAAIVLVPLVFMVQTGQGQDFVKQVILLATVSLAVLCWIGSMLVNRALSLRRTVANPVVLVLLAAVLLTALVSGARYLGLVGGAGQEYQSFVTTLLFVAFFFVVVNLPTHKEFSAKAIFAATVVGGLVSFLALFQFMGVHLIPGVSNSTFNLVGSTVVLGLYAATTVVLASASFLTEIPAGKLALVKRIAVGVSGACALLVAVSIDFWPVWLAMIVGLLAILAFAIVRPQAIGRLGWLAVPMACLVIAVLLFIINIPFPIHAPTEVFPSFKQSFDVARSTLVAHPIFGAGPGNFAHEFALHRGLALNQSPLWYVQFDRGMSYLTTVASTMGVAGLVAWLAVIVIGLWKSSAYLIASRKKDDEGWVLALAVSAAWLTAAVGLIVYGTSLSSLLLFWLLFAVLIRSTSVESAEVRFEASPRSGLVITFAFVILIVVALAGWFISASRLYADVSLASASALDTSTKADAIISKLENAMRMDSNSDAIARNLSQAYLIKIQQVFNDPKLDATTRSSEVKELTSAAVKTGLAATQLAPDNVQNWAQLGAVYEAIASYVSNAADQATAAYQHAADLDPTSPVHLTSLGRISLAVARLSLASLNTIKDDAGKAAAQKKADDALASAVASFQGALKLKADYGPAAYQLALTYDAQGKLKEAIASLNDVLLANPTDVGVGFEMASLYYRNGQKDKAQAELESLVKAAPNFANGRWLLATIYEENKQFGQAIAQVQEILKTNADNKDVQDYLQKLQDEKDGKTPVTPSSPPALKQ